MHVNTYMHVGTISRDKCNLWLAKYISINKKSTVCTLITYCWIINGFANCGVVIKMVVVGRRGEKATRSATQIAAVRKPHTVAADTQNARVSFLLTQLTSLRSRYVYSSDDSTQWALQIAIDYFCFWILMSESRTINFNQIRSCLWKFEFLKKLSNEWREAWRISLAFK